MTVIMFVETTLYYIILVQPGYSLSVILLCEWHKFYSVRNVFFVMTEGHIFCWGKICEIY